MQHLFYFYAIFLVDVQTLGKVFLQGVGRKPSDDSNVGIEFPRFVRGEHRRGLDMAVAFFEELLIFLPEKRYFRAQI